MLEEHDLKCRWVKLRTCKSTIGLSDRADLLSETFLLTKLVRQTKQSIVHKITPDMTCLYTPLNLLMFTVELIMFMNYSDLYTLLTVYCAQRISGSKPDSWMNWNHTNIDYIYYIYNQYLNIINYLKRP